MIRACSTFWVLICEINIMEWYYTYIGRCWPTWCRTIDFCHSYWIICHKHLFYWTCCSCWTVVDNVFTILILCWFVVNIYILTCRYQWILSFTLITEVFLRHILSGYYVAMKWRHFDDFFQGGEENMFFL